MYIEPKMNAATETFALPLRNTFAAINSIYALAAKAGFDRDMLNAWYNGAMAYETGMVDTSGSGRSDNKPELRAAFFVGEAGKIPLNIYAAADRQRQAAKVA